MATWTDEALDRVARRVRKRQRKADGERRRARLAERLARIEGWRALPEGQRPERKRIPVQLDSVQGVLRTAATVLGGTPLGPVLSGMALGLGAIDKVRGATEAKDREALVEAVAAEVAARVGPGHDDAVEEVVEDLEDALL
jgi:hypothetical protein